MYKFRPFSLCKITKMKKAVDIILLLVYNVFVKTYVGTAGAHIGVIAA